MMSNIVRSATAALRISTMRSITPLGRRDFARTFWHMSKQDNISGASMIALKKPSVACSCGCGSMHKHTKGETDLVEFLTEEVMAEKSTQKGKVIPKDIDGFKVTLNGAEVELTKETEKEKIVISFNINHTVDTDGEDEFEESDESGDKPMTELKSTPTFEVDIIKGGKTLSFTCSFLKSIPQEGEYNDVFGIDEITLYQGEYTDKDYAVAGDVLDGYFYDLLMNLLEEKGITSEFANKLSDLSTNHEHATYIGLLEELSKFTLSGK